MADYKKIIPHILKWEGGLSGDPNDLAAKGGGVSYLDAHGKERWAHTNKGIQWQYFKAYAPSLGYEASVQNFLKMPMDIWQKIWKSKYWDFIHGDQIKDQHVADIIAEMAWGMGGGTAGKITQKALNTLGFNLIVDGGIGPQTLTAINKADPVRLFQALHDGRIAHFKAIVAANPSQQVFWEGWMNRITDFYNQKKKYLKAAGIGITGIAIAVLIGLFIANNLNKKK